MDKLFIGIQGHAVCLNKSSGEVLWKVKLKGSSITNIYYTDGDVFAYANGHLFCLEAANGNIKWENSLKGLGYGPCIIASEHQSSAVITNQDSAQQAGAVTGVVAVSAATNSGS